MLRSIFFSLGLIGLSFGASAGLYPVATDVTIVHFNLGTPRYYAEIHFGQRLIEVGNITERIVPPGYLMGLIYRRYSPAAFSSYPPYINPVPAPGTGAQGFVTVNPGETLGSAALRAYAGQGYIRHVRYGRSRLVEACIVYAAFPNDLTPANLFTNAIFPPGLCVSVPSTSDWCAITTPSLTIDHGTVLLSIDSGNTKDEPIDINCTAPMRVKIKFGEDVLNLSNSIRANLSILNGNGGEQNLPEGNSRLMLRSTLSVDQTATAGSYQGATVVTVEYY